MIDLATHLDICLCSNMLLSTLCIVLFSYFHQDILCYLFHSCIRSYGSIRSLASQWPLVWTGECKGKDDEKDLLNTIESSSRCVHFSDVSVRNYQVIEFPDNKVKPFITLDWTYDTEIQFSIDHFEALRQPTVKKMRRPRQPYKTVAKSWEKKQRKWSSKKKKANKGRPTLQRIKLFTLERKASQLSRWKQRKTNHTVVYKCRKSESLGTENSS